jgi:phospholipid/cholesterol/gamma-HCH transport system substrate-binding protein
MASSQKTNWAQLKIGLVAAVALSVLAVLIILLSGTNPLFQKTTELFTYFDDSFAMTASATPVRLNGILIGTVKKIDLSGSPEQKRAVKVTLSIDNEYLPMIPVDSTAKLAQQNLLGSRYINVTRGKSGQLIQPGGEIASAETAELEDLFQQGQTTLGALQNILKRVENLVVLIESGEGTIGKFLRDPKLYNTLTSAAEEMNKMVIQFNSPDSTVGKLMHDDALYEDLRGTLAKTNMMLDGLNNGQGTMGKLLKDEGLYEEVRGTIGDLRETLNLINHGNGTVGKLMNSDELHTRLEGTMSRLDEVLNHINSGEGTIGQLLLNPQLYESMDGTMREVQGFMKDFRANPKKFLTIQLKLF